MKLETTDEVLYWAYEVQRHSDQEWVDPGSRAADRATAERIAKAMRDAQVQRTHWDRDAVNAELAAENKRLKDRIEALEREAADLRELVEAYRSGAMTSRLGDDFMRRPR